MTIGTNLVQLTDRATIERFLRTDPALHLYALGDLDEFFWPHTTWYGLMGPRGLRAVFLLYRAVEPAVLLALEEDDPPAALELLALVVPSLPRQFYAHLSPHLMEPLGTSCRLEPHSLHLKMLLSDPRTVLEPRWSHVLIRVLGTPDLPAILELYRQAYAGNWFDARMLETGQYRGAFAGDELVAIAGVHVYSERYRVAALGNVATHPLSRGQGLGTAVTAALCRSLLSRVDGIGLNVKADSLAALRCYEKLGFEKRAGYHEAMVVR